MKKEYVFPMMDIFLIRKEDIIKCSLLDQGDVFDGDTGIDYVDWDVFT